MARAAQYFQGLIKKGTALIVPIVAGGGKLGGSKLSFSAPFTRSYTIRRLLLLLLLSSGTKVGQVFSRGEKFQNFSSSMRCQFRFPFLATPFEFLFMFEEISQRGEEKKIYNM